MNKSQFFKLPSADRLLIKTYPPVLKLSRKIDKAKALPAALIHVLISRRGFLAKSRQQLFFTALSTFSVFPQCPNCRALAFAQIKID